MTPVSKSALFNSAVEFSIPENNPKTAIDSTSLNPLYTGGLFHCYMLGQSVCHYTPGIYAAGYIVFALTFVRSYVRSFVRSCVRSFVTFRHVRRIYIKVFG